MNEQEVFNKVATHLWQQNRQASIINPLRGGTPTCQYRTTLKNGKKLACAVGCLIPDQEYIPSFEGKDVQGLFLFLEEKPEIEVPVTRNLLSEHYYLLDSLQSVHDSNDIVNKDKSFNKRRLRADLKSVADRFRLVYDQDLVESR